MLVVAVYKLSSGKQPYFSWVESLDKKCQAIIAQRLERVCNGNFGDCKSIKNSKGVFELRIDHGSGYRIYFGKVGISIILLLAGGDKGSQKRDIADAMQYWKKFKEQKHA